MFIIEFLFLNWEGIHKNHEMNIYHTQKLMKCNLKFIYFWCLSSLRLNLSTLLFIEINFNRHQHQYSLLWKRNLILHRTGTMICRKLLIWCHLPKDAFDKIMRRFQEKNKAGKIGFLRKFDAFDDVPHSKLKKVMPKQQRKATFLLIWLLDKLYLTWK